jgi:hypothetical protein
MLFASRGLWDCKAVAKGYGSTVLVDSWWPGNKISELLVWAEEYQQLSAE